MRDLEPTGPSSKDPDGQTSSHNVYRICEDGGTGAGAGIL